MLEEELEVIAGVVGLLEMGSDEGVFAPRRWDARNSRHN